MGPVLQFAAFLSICWLIRGVITHPNLDGSKKLTNEPPNQNNPGGRDFYFEEQRINDDNIKTGRAIPQSAWSKEEKEQTQTVENKTGTQSNDEFSLKSVLSYMLNMVQELKKDIFGIKKLVNSQDKFEDRNKQNEMKVRNDVPKSGDSPEYREFKSENQQHRSNYLTDYYQKNGIKFVDDEEEDDDLENFSDQSDDSSHQPNKEVSIQEININNKNRNQNDDSSHKPNDGVNKQEIIKNNKNRYSYKCARITRKPGIYSEVEKITTIPKSQNKIPEENGKKFDYNKENGKDNNFKESTTKPSTAERNNLKSSREETENLTTAPSSSKMGKCVKKNNMNSINNPNEKNYPAEKPLNSVEYVTTRSPQNENSDKTNSKRSNQNKTPVNLPKVTSPSSKTPGKNTKNKNVTKFNNKSGVQLQSTTLSSQDSKDFTYLEKMENTNEPYTSDMFFENSTYKKQQEQNTSPKPANEKQIQNYAKFLKNTVRANEKVTVSTPKHRMSTKAYTLGTEINDNLKESKDKRFNVISSRTTITYNENNPNSKIDGQQNNFDTDNIIQSTTSGNMLNMDNLDKNISNNFTDKKGTNKNDESEKLNANNKDKSDSENERNSETEQPNEQQTNNGPEPEISLKNKIKDSKPDNSIKEADDNLSSTTLSDPYSSQDSKSEFQNHDAEEFGKAQEPQESNENLSENDEMHEISPDQEYEYEDETEDFDTSDEIINTQDIQNQESEVNINDGKYGYNDEMYPTTVLINESQISEQTGYAMKEGSEEQYGTFTRHQESEVNISDGKYENNDEMHPTTVLINESQISEQTGYAMKEGSEEQYGTFLEYIYKHSNNSFFQSLKSQSNNSSHGGY